MKEIEAKFKIADPEGFKNSLKNIGAEHQSSQSQVDTYYVHRKSNDLTNTPTFLRVRSSNEKAYVSFHYKLESYIWEELETLVEDGNKLRDIFRLTGHDVDIEVAKLREVYLHGDTEIVLDDVKGLGIFAEVEAKSLEEMIKVCGHLNLDLELQAKELEGKSYADLLRDFKANA